jgi:hypothetical protein
MNNILVVCVLAKMIAERKGEINTKDSWANNLILKKRKMMSYTVTCGSLSITAFHSLVKILLWQYVLKVLLTL